MRSLRPSLNTLSASVIGLALVLAACTSPTTTPPPAATKPPAGPAATTAPAAPAATQPAAAPAATKPPAAPAPAAATGTPIKVGVLNDITGVGAIEGALMRISTELAIQQANATGGINGRPLQAIYVDPKGDATQALQLATQLAQQDNVDVLTGGIFSPECLGVQGLAERLGLVYVPLNGCATQDFTAKSCSRYTFRIYPAGRQTSDPSVAHLVKTYGSKWAIIYPDYALGQSNLATSKAALERSGGQYVIEIPVPLGEPNVTPYVTRVPTDGSVQVLYNTSVGSDLARVMSVIQQFGINQKVTVYSVLGKESFGGVYPDALNGALITGNRPSDGLPGNQSDEEFSKAWIEMGRKLGDITAPLGGPEKLTPGSTNGYNAYITMNALKLAMRAANFTGKADTDKLIAAMETLNVPQGADFPAGPMIMNKDDHQGRITQYLLRISGQKEEIVQTFPAETLPTIGDCKIAA